MAVPPQVLAQYQSVTSRANQTANTPFQSYGGEFVAPVNAEQTSGIVGTNAAANEAQPYFGAATGVLAGTQAATTPVNTAAENQTAASSAPLTGAQIDQYLSPYLGTVLNSTEAIQNQENEQQQAGQLGNAIRSGAFGSDRTGIAAANLEQQQNLANANVISNIANTGYQSALSTAQGQQQIGLAGAAQEAGIGQTAYGEGANTATTLAGLGAGAQSAALTGAQAQIGAGTVQQQTQQAADTAKYNQFLQQQSYPFQVDQFLADIAEGTGSLSGSTTTTRQPGGFFSDERLKHDIQKIGETFDGQPIYSYKMGDDGRTRMGLIAQEVEKKHPGAVGVAGGFKMVDYGKATKDAANKGHFYTGGVVPFRRVHRDMGGGLGGVLQAQQAMYAGMPSQQQRQVYAGGVGGNHQLAVAQAPNPGQKSGASDVSQTMSLAQKGYKLYKDFSTPSAAPATSALPAGVSPAVGAGPTSAELATTAPAATTPIATGVAPAASAAAPAAASAAAPAAADAAASAAAPAAADAAGTAAAAAAPAAATAAGTAAGTAAVGAGTGAAAEAAAALAAEYAAAEVGTAAVIAAKKGGRIQRQSGGSMPYGGNGLPYSDSSGLNIPNEQRANTLKAAPAAAKQPTGLQTALYMGNPNDASTLMGSLFSNQAFAKGGVAGRRGFDDGGGTGGETDDGQDTAAPPAQAPDTSQPSGGGLAGFWERHKGIIIPALEGVGAALTAPTSHPGVAIAAGLEAAAKGYAPTQVELARAEREQALAQAQELENVPLGVRARIAQTIPIPGQGGVAGSTQAPAPRSSGVAPPQPPPQEAAPATSGMVPPTPSLAAPGVQPSGAVTFGAPATAPAIRVPTTGAQPSPQDAMTAAQLDNYYRNEIPTPGGGRGYFVNTAGTPAQLAAIQVGKEQDWALGPGVTFNQDNARLAMERQIKSALLTNQNAAQAQAAQFYNQYMNPAATAQEREMALANYNAVRQWTGDKTEIQGGIVKNQRTQLPEIGPISAQGVTPTERASLYNYAVTPQVFGGGLPTPPYKHFNFATPEQYVDAVVGSSQVGGAPYGGPPSAPTAAAPPNAGTASTAPPPRSPAAPAGPSAPPQAPPQRAAAPPVTAIGGPYAQQAFVSAHSSPAYEADNGPPAIDQATLAARTSRMQANQKNSVALGTTASEIINEQANVKMYLTSALDILNSKGGAPWTGFPGMVRAAIGEKFNTVNAGNYEAVAKYLMNAAVQQGHTNFPNATQSEFAQQVGSMSPNVRMPPQTIRELAQMGLRTANWMIASADRAQVWAKDQSLDPLSFEGWNNTYFPRDKLVNAESVATNPKTHQRMYKINGRWTQ